VGVEDSRNEIFVKTVFSLQTYDDNNIEVIKTMIDQYTIEGVPYPEIADYVFKEQTYNLSDLENLIIDSEKFNDEYGEFMEKFLRHAKLAETQMNYIEKAIRNSEKEVNAIQNKYDELQTKYTRLIEQASSIYSEFISILGIFSALIFGLFGGFDTLTSSIRVFIRSNSYGQAIFYISVMGVSLITFVYFLLYWIGLIIDKPIHRTDNGYKPGLIENISRGFSKMIYGEKKDEPSFTKKHKTYLMIVTSFGIMSLIGIGLHLLEANIPINGWSFIISLIIILLLILFLIRLMKKIGKGN